jgi:hypothetical protein
MSVRIDPPKPPSHPALFSLGRVVATPGALHLLNQTATDPSTLLLRHITGDWGDICTEDAAENRLSLEQNFRLMSVYRLPLVQQSSGEDAFPSNPASARGTTDVGQPIWVITEADRSCTTLLLPSEY